MGSDLGLVTAVILTHMRPTLAGDLTRSLLEVEGLAADRIVVVVNGVGGLDDPALESRVRMLRLPENIGPAGGFKAGMIEAFSDTATSPPTMQPAWPGQGSRLPHLPARRLVEMQLDPAGG